MKTIILSLMLMYTNISLAQTVESNFLRHDYTSIVVLSGGIHEFSRPVKIETPEEQNKQQQQCQQGSGCHYPTMYIQCSYPDRQQMQQCQQHQDGTPCSEDIYVELKYNETIQVNRTLYVCLEK